jgi:hypothetical protein
MRQDGRSEIGRDLWQEIEPSAYWLVMLRAEATFLANNEDHLESIELPVSL